nr:glutamate receptor 2.7-like isoform X2 [Erigeron canadensis]
METSIGKMTSTCILMAIHDFYEKHSNYTTMIHPHFRDSKQDNVRAASAAIDLLKNVQVMAILGPQTSSQAAFVIDIGNTSRVPIISPATSPSLSPTHNVYFIRIAPDSSSQLKPIAELIKYFGWREVALIYEDSEYGRGLVPYFTDVMLAIGTKLMPGTIIYPSASDDSILKKLYKLKGMQTRVFVVHALPALASHFFKKVTEAGMMVEGYVWIITEVLTSRLHSLDPTDIDLMQGVLGVKSYIPRSSDLITFEKRWKQEFWSQNPNYEMVELDMFGLWAYDSIFALAMALEKISSEAKTTFQREMESSTDLDTIGTSEIGSRLVPWIRNSSFKGLSGEFHVVDGQLQWSDYQIVNIIGMRENPIGFWTPKNGILKKLNNQTKGLRAIIWPGDSHVIPKGLKISTINILRVGVPFKSGFQDFLDCKINPQTQQVVVTGFCVDIFEAVVRTLPYSLKHEFIPFVGSDGKSAGTYDDLLRSLANRKYDAVVGDITVSASRSEYVDFTFPYTEAGTAMIVRIKDEKKSTWIFMRPLEKELWIATGALFIYTGIVIWVLERRVNEEFRGSSRDQVGMIFWFSFSTLVYAHREKLMSNLSRFVVIVWVFVVLVLTSSYTASLTSMLTVQQLQPTDIFQIMRKGESVGYQQGSFTRYTLKTIGFDDSKLKSYGSFEQYDEALQKGSQNGGVSAIFDELPYLRAFMVKYCTKYTMTGYTNNTAGFGFAFPKGSPLVHDFSTAVLQVRKHQTANISIQWFGESAGCDQKNETSVEPNRLTLDRFKGLFFIAMLSSTSALVFFFFMVLYQNREMLVSHDSIAQKIVVIAKTFNEFKDSKSQNTSAAEAVDEPVGEDNISSSPTSDHPEVRVISPGEDTSSTEPGTPVPDTIQGLSTTELGTPGPNTNGLQVVETTTQN